LLLVILVEGLPAFDRRKVRTMSSQYGLNRLGYTGATMVKTKGSKSASWSKSQKNHLSSDCPLQLEGMKAESLVIVKQHATVNL
jgi:hypothetical protein